MLTNTESSSEQILQAARLVADVEVPDWYHQLFHLVEENCTRRLVGLDHLLDNREWLVVRPAVTLWTRRNQLRNVTVSWEPTRLHMGLEVELHEFGPKLLDDCYQRRNEFMHIGRAAFVGPTDDERVRRASGHLCDALVARHGELVSTLRGAFDLTVNGRLRAPKERQPLGNGLVVEN